MSRSTPWGSAQDVINHARGISTVFTAGHGGLMVSKGVGDKLLSESARSRALIHGNYYCYEEDCAVYIPLLDSEELRAAYIPSFNYFSKMSSDEVETTLINFISGYYPDFVLEIGKQPDEEGYAKWKLRKKEEAARKEKSPDLVISVSKSGIKGVNRVLTADGSEHFVTKESCDANRGIYMDLTKMELVDDLVGA